MSFTQFMQQVDVELGRMVGLTHSDLADYPYRDAYDDEVSPREVAAEVLENEGF